jgi:hypothetical protein
LFTLASGHAYEIYESGGSDHGSKAANEAAGHIQREWFIDAINTSDADWKYIICETPIYGTEFGYSGIHFYQLWPTFDASLDCQRQYLVENIDYSYVFWVGADQHFAAIDDGKTSAPPFPCVNAAPLFGKFQKSNVHVPSKSHWTVDGDYAAWGRDLPGVVWSDGAYTLIEHPSRRSVIVSIRDFTGTILDNDELSTTGTLTSDASATRIFDNSKSWTDMEFQYDALVFTTGAAVGKQFFITGNQATTIRVQASNVMTGALTGDRFRVSKRHHLDSDGGGTVYQDDAAPNFLGKLTMELTELTYYILHESFNTSDGTGYDDTWTEVT